MNRTEGNFIRTVRLIAEFDPILNNLLYNENNKIKYLSWKIQNELIQILSSEVLNILGNEVRESKYYSIIMDSTQDVTKIDQLSVILRYVKVNYENKSIEVKESFFGFFLIKETWCSRL